MKIQTADRWPAIFWRGLQLGRLTATAPLAAGPWAALLRSFALAAGPLRDDVTQSASSGSGVAAPYVPGSEADFRRLYEETYPRLVRSFRLLTTSPAEAEDICQDAYLRAYQAWPRWKPDAPAEAWVWRIAMNVLVGRARQRKVRGAIDKLRGAAGPTQVPATDISVRSDLSRAMATLPPTEAAALLLRHVHGYNITEVSQRLGVGVRTVNRLLVRGAATMQAALGNTYAGRAETTSSPAREIEL